VFELLLLGAAIFLAIRLDALSQRLARLEQLLGEPEEQSAGSTAANGVARAFTCSPVVVCDRTTRRAEQWWASLHKPRAVGL